MHAKGGKQDLSSPCCSSGKKKEAHAPDFKRPIKKVHESPIYSKTPRTGTPSLLACLLTFAVLGVGRGRDGGQAEEGGHKGGQEEEGEMGAHDDDEADVWNGLLCLCCVWGKEMAKSEITCA